MALRGLVQGAPPVLQAGKFPHRVQFVVPSNVQDSTGGWSVNVVKVVFTCWASVEALTASDKFAAHEFSSRVTHFVYIRHPRSAVPGGITSNMMVQFNGRQFQVEGVMDPNEKKKVLCITVIEIDDSVNQSAGSQPESNV